MVVSDASSSSGFIDNQTNSSIDSQWSDITPILNNRHGKPNALYRAKRYGRYFMLKTIDFEATESQTPFAAYARATGIYHNLLHKEFTLGVQLDHPNIAHTLYMENIPDLGECIVMEYIDGEIWQKNVYAPKAQKRLFLQLLDAVGYLHSKQIVHRDLKPTNILVTRNGQNIKLIDFGLSDADDYAILKQPAGTRKYIAPEQLAGEPLDMRADIYSLGVIMKEMLPRYPYRRIASKCMHTNKTKRYANCDAIVQAIQKADKRKVWLPIALIITVLAALLSLSVAFNAHQQKQLQVEQKHLNDLVFITNTTSDSLQAYIQTLLETKDEYEQQIAELTEYQNKLLDCTEDRQILENLMLGWWQKIEDKYNAGEIKNLDEFKKLSDMLPIWDTVEVMAKERYPKNSVPYNNFISIASAVSMEMICPRLDPIFNEFLLTRNK